MVKKIKNFLKFLKFIEEEKIKASIHCKTSSNLF